MAARTQLGLACMEETAVFSPCRTWRYTLHRQWADGPAVAYLMFNPSTADESVDDPTIRKCRGFAQRLGYGRMTIVNLFAVRGTDPRIVGRVEDAVGPLNNWHIYNALLDCRMLVCAWGCGGHMRGNLARRPAEVMKLLEPLTGGAGLRVMCLGYSANGSPRHPLMLGYNTPLQPYTGDQTR